MPGPQMSPQLGNFVHTHSLDENHYAEVNVTLTGDDKNFPGFADSVYEQPASDTKERGTGSDPAPSTPLCPPPVLLPRGIYARKKSPIIPDTESDSRRLTTSWETSKHGKSSLYEFTHINYSLQ